VSPKWLLVIAVAGCGFEEPRFQSMVDARGDAPGIPPDIQPVVPQHLLLSEIQATEVQEFVEIYNPNDTAIDLTNYYISDTREYWRLPGQIAGNLPLIVVAQSDYLLRFPTGSTIGPHGVQTIAAVRQAFFDNYNDMQPTYAIIGGLTAAQQMIPMVSNANPSPQVLTNNGEFVVLFQWDGTSDLVRDVDIVVYGNMPDPGAFNTLIQKAPVDGPDLDVTTSAYATDAITLGDFLADPADDTSFKRTKLEGTNEVQSGGNGIDGDDETTEMLRETWEESTSEPTPGTVPASLLP
jgi:uncharacterized protein